MFSVEQLTGNDPSQLIALPDSLSCKQKQHIHIDVIDALTNLQSLADKDKVPFKVLSSYRSFEDQKSIWNRKFEGSLPILDINENIVDTDSQTTLQTIHSILLFSALPGASRHHWGTDFDIFPTAALDSGYQPQLLKSEFTNHGIASELNQWLNENLPKTNFFRPYEKYRQGIAQEPWHISYHPIADKALSELTISQLKSHLTKEKNLAGQKEICEQLGSIYEQYICNICNGDQHD